MQTAHRADDAQHCRNEQQLAELNADVEKQQREWYASFGQTDLAQRARKSETVEQAERERDDPRRPRRKARSPVSRADDLDCDEGDD